MLKIQAEVLADSLCKYDGPDSPNKSRLTTLLVCAPRIILAEINTHRMLSRNAASSRAIPIYRKISQVKESPFVPIYWGANEKGMQSFSRVGRNEEDEANEIWINAAHDMCEYAKKLADLNVHKQFANRLLEPFAWCYQLISFTDCANMFNLRIDENAEPHFFELAGQILKAMMESEPRELRSGDWHIPFSKNTEHLKLEEKIKVATARAARLSYENFSGNTSTEEDLRLAETLTLNGHLSPHEHIAMAIDRKSVQANIVIGRSIAETSLRTHGPNSSCDYYWGNFRWFVQYRKTIFYENRNEINPDKLLEKWEKIRKERGYY